MVALLTLFEREIKRFIKVLVQTIVTPLVSSFLYLTVFGVSLGSRIQEVDGVPYLCFLLPGLMMMSLMNNAFQNSASSIVTSKFSGDLEDFRVAPLSNYQLIFAFSLAALVRGAIVAGVTYLVGFVFYYIQFQKLLPFAHPFVVIFFVFISGLIFGLLGIAVAFMAQTMDQLSAFSAFILLPLTYLGGVFVSIKNLHPIWQTLSKWNPLLYLINGLRYGFLGVSDVSIESCIWMSLISFCVLYFSANLSLSRGSFQRW